MKNRNNLVKGYLSAVLVMIMASLSYGQMSVKGKLLAEHGNPMSFAHIMLRKASDSTFVSGAVTDGKGGFLIEDVQAGNYMLHATMLGYVPIYTSISIAEGRDKIQTVLQMKPDAQQLDEVQVMAKKPIYERKIDRTVIHVQNSILSAGSTALEVLEKSPGVVVNRQNNSLSMNGKNGVLVMVNNKMTRLPIDAVVQMLDGMSSSNIDKIELITNPPAKYDAEGNAGIINIKMVENRDNGTNGSFGLTGGYNRAETLGSNFNLNHRNKQFNAFLDYVINYDRNKHEWTVERIWDEGPFKRHVLDNSRRYPSTTVQNLRTGLEYEFNKKTTSKLLITGYRRNWDMDALTENVNTIDADSSTFSEMILHEKNIWQSVTGSAGIAYRWDSLQHLSFDFDYLFYDNNNPSNYDISFLNSTGQETKRQITHVSKRTPINFKIAKLDYTNKLSGKFSIETGLKATISRFNNKVVVSSEVDGESRTDEQLTNDSNLKEKIFAAYFSWQWDMTKNLTLNGGLRYEFTDSYLSTPEESGLVDRSFGNFFPSLFVSKKLNDQSKIQMAYSNRISRPTFNEMAPYVFFIGPSTFVGGNLNLKPAITDGVDLTYQLERWQVTVKYSYTKNSIAFLQPEINTTTNELIFRSQNLKYVRSWGLSTNFPIRLASWWEIQNDFSIYHQTYETNHLNKNVKDNVVSMDLNITNSFTLPNDYSTELSGDYHSNSLWGISRFEPMWKINFGFKKKLKNDMGILTLSANDIFNSSVWKIETRVPEFNLTSHFNYDFSTRSINLTYTKNFGNKKLKSVDIDSGSEAERKRVN